MSYHADEDYIGMNGLLTNENTERYAEDIKELLSKYYTWDNDCEEFDETAPDNYNEYRIKAVFTDSCGDDDFTDILLVDVKLPTDEAAKELADIIDGTVISGLNKGCPTYRITYRNEIYIKADTKEEAEKIFRNMSRSDLDANSEFVEIVSNEKED